MKKLKIYYVCDGRHKTWYNCVGMLSNGFIFAQYTTAAFPVLKGRGENGLLLSLV